MRLVIDKAARDTAGCERNDRDRPKHGSCYPLESDRTSSHPPEWRSLLRGGGAARARRIVWTSFRSADAGCKIMRDSGSKMKRLTPISRLSIIRLLPIVGVLLGLCISEGVGLQLLPPPIRGDKQERSSRPTPAAIDPDCSCPAPRTGHGSGRVEIVPPKLEKYTPERPMLQAADCAPVSSDGIESVSPEQEYLQRAESPYSLILVLEPSGRAPPDLG